VRIWRMRGRFLGRLRGSWGLLSEFPFEVVTGKETGVLMRDIVFW
jgi:hypothetical protein